MNASVAVSAAALGAWLALGPNPASRLEVLRSRRAPRTRAPGESRGAFALAAAAVGMVMTGGLLGGALGAGGGLLVHRAWQVRRAERAAARTRDALPDVLRLLAAELHAGAVPQEALGAAAASAPGELGAHLGRVAAGARLGLPPAETLVPGPPGSDGLATLAACWRVSVVAGAGLADGVARLAAGLSADARCRAEVEAQLAGPRATASLLAALPALAVVMAAGLGATPWAFFRSGPGLACLAIGVSLDVAGVAWTRRIAKAAMP
ncbi:MAG TPA: type II secretion system F family protein [Mycobacteriales bacterium]|nr:type II secretion system F family protein [Mycobacteriales bacterium]